MTGIILYGLLYKLLFIILVISIMNLIVVGIQIYGGIQTRQYSIKDIFKTKLDYFIFLFNFAYVITVMFTGIGVL